MRLLLLLAALASPVAADPMSADAFEAYVTGKTLAFIAADGTTFGIEQYLPDRRVIWSASPGDCLDGRWFAQNDEICFVYDGDPLPKCWDVSLTDTGLRATSPLFGTVLLEAQTSPPLTCTGPDLLS